MADPQCELERAVVAAPRLEVGLAHALEVLARDPARRDDEGEERVCDRRVTPIGEQQPVAVRVDVADVQVPVLDGRDVGELGAELRKTRSERAKPVALVVGERQAGEPLGSRVVGQSVELVRRIR
jgi:hypothetical protein